MSSADAALNPAAAVALAGGAVRRTPERFIRRSNDDDAGAQAVDRMAVTVLAILAGAGAALAGLGQPSPWQIGLQQSATPVMDDIVWFHDFLLYIITAITAVRAGFCW